MSSPPVPAKPAAKPAERVVSFGIDDTDRRTPGTRAVGPHGGFIVTAIEKFSSAAKAGIVVGDEVVAVNGKKVASAAEALAAAQAAGIGGSLAVELHRAGGPRQPVTMKLFEKKSLKFDIGEVDTVLERKIAPA